MMSDGNTCAAVNSGNSYIKIKLGKKKEREIQKAFTAQKMQLSAAIQWTNEQTNLSFIHMLQSYSGTLHLLILGLGIANVPPIEAAINYQSGGHLDVHHIRTFLKKDFLMVCSCLSVL